MKTKLDHYLYYSSLGVVYLSSIVRDDAIGPTLTTLWGAIGDILPENSNGDYI
jgi:hypothetical protein